jgi:hypothetical protein
MDINHNQTWDSDGNLIFEEYVEVTPTSLNIEGVFATLNVVLGIWSLEDAANAIGRKPEQLVAEAQSWAVAQGKLL